MDGFTVKAAAGKPGSKEAIRLKGHGLNILSCFPHFVLS
jgi:hypothetical protein